jgi:hypothetical protein
VVWLLKHSLDKLCSQYADKRFAGKGEYTRVIPDSKFEAFFDVTYTPPMVVYSEDENAFPLSVPKREVKVSARTTGLIRVSDKKAVDDIYSSLRTDKNHSFSFLDSKTGLAIKGTIDFVLPAPEVGPHVLSLGAGELSITDS